MLSDSFPMEEVDGVMLKVKSSIITKGALSVNTGANAAAEATEDDETVDDPTVGAPPQFLSLHLARVAQRCCSHTAGPLSTRGDTSARLDPDPGPRAPADVQAEKVNDVVDAFNLQSMGGFDKAAALSWVSSLSSPPRRLPRAMRFPRPRTRTCHNHRPLSRDVGRHWHVYAPAACCGPRGGVPARAR